MAVAGATILHTPSWVSYEPQSRLLNRPVLRIPASPQDGHKLYPARLQQLLRNSPHVQHLLILNSPSNPTGQMLEPGLLEEIADICRRDNVLVLSDEIYGLTAFGREHVSISSFYPEGTVVLGGKSKHLSLGGWRLGTAIVPPGEGGQRLLQAAAKIGSELWSTASAPIQYAAITAYTEDSELSAYIERCTGLHAARTRYLWRGLCELDVPCAEPMGGFYLFPNFDHWRKPLAARGVHTSVDLARHLLDEWQIATLPGTDFGTPATELSLRLSTSYVDLETDEKAAKLFELADGSISEQRLMRDFHPGMNEVLARLQNFLSSM
jgi:aspartate/methionine/tyrosine aminotransferase